MVDLTNVQKLIGVLQVLCGGDPSQVKKVEKTLQPFLSNENCIFPLMEILSHSGDDAVREQAGRLLKKEIGGLFSKFSLQQQTTLKNQLVEKLLSERNSALYHLIAAIIVGTTYKVPWPELASLLKRLVNEKNEKNRLLAFILLSELSRKMWLPVPTTVVCEVLLVGCKESVDYIAPEALTAITNCITQMGQAEDVMDLSPILPPFVQMLNRFLVKGRDDLFISGFECLQETFMFAQPLINEHIPTLTEFSLKLLLDPEHDLDHAVKEAVSDVLINLIELRALPFVKKKLVKPTLSALIGRIAKEKGCVLQDAFSREFMKEGVEKDGLEEDESATNESLRVCQVILDQMANAIPAKYLASTLFEMSEEAMLSLDIDLRKAGYAVLGMTVEGLHNETRDEAGLHVREAASFALAEFCQNCSPEIYRYHSMIIPVAMKGLHDVGFIVQGRCCQVLEFVCAKLKSKEIKPFLSPLINCLSQLARGNIPLLQRVAIKALAATAIAAENEFQCYADGVMVYLESLLILCENGWVKAAALVCSGHIALAVGKESFKPFYHTAGMKVVSEALKTENSQLIESSLIYIATVAGVIKKDFESEMKELFPYIIQIIEEKESFIPEVNEMNTSDDEEDGNIALNLQVHHDDCWISTRVSAIAAIGSLAENIKSCFLPYLNQTIDAFITAGDGVLYSVHADIRCEAISMLKYLIEVPIDASTIHTPAPGERLDLPEPVQFVTAEVLKQCFYILDSDNQIEVVSNAFLTIDTVLKRLGVAVLELPVLEFCKRSAQPCSIILNREIVKYLNESGTCQAPDATDDYETNEENDNDNDADEENLIHLLKNISNLIGTCAKILGNHFIAPFDQFYIPLLKFTNPSRSEAEQNLTICCFAKVFDGIGSSSLIYADSVLKVLKRILVDLECSEETRRNAAFCLGTLIDACRADLIPRYLEFLQWLHPIFIQKREEIGGADVDNALSAVAKMIVVAPEALPLGHVLPVMFSALLMKYDFDQTIEVLKAFFVLIRKMDPTIIGMLKELMPLLVKNFEPDSEIPDAGRELAALCLTLLAANPACNASVHSYITSITDRELRRRLKSAFFNQDQKYGW